MMIHLYTICVEYNTMYIIDPGCTMKVEGLPAKHIRVAIVYDATPDGNVLMYQSWLCKHESTMTISQFIGADISVLGGMCIHLRHTIFVII
jgi:hypothetical protein